MVALPQTPSIIIISGAPGSGKSTVSQGLGKLFQIEGHSPVHLTSDTFFSFPLDAISPERPEARAQNETVSKAVAASALAFASGGYTVLLDGVIGPWILPHYLTALQTPGIEAPGTLAYIVLRAPLAETLTRAANRSDSDKFPEEGVRTMHRQFADLKMFEPHVMETGGLTPEETTNGIQSALAAGHFRIALSGVQ